MSEPSPGERSRPMRCFTASGIGRNWPRWSAPQASPRSSGEICFLILRCTRFRRRLGLSLLLKAGPAQHRASLRRLEGDGCLCTAHRAGGARLRAHSLRSPHALRLALLAMLRVVFKLFVVEKDLLACRKNKLGAAVNACEDSIGEFHCRLPAQGLTPKSATALKELAGPGSLFLFVMHNKGPVRMKIKRFTSFCPVNPGSLTCRTQIACQAITRDSQVSVWSQHRAGWPPHWASQTAATASLDRNGRNATANFAAAPCRPGPLCGIWQLPLASNESRRNGLSRCGLRG